MLSLLNPTITAPLPDPSKGIPPTALQPLLSWFKQAFHQLPSSSGHQEEEAGAGGQVNGVNGITEQLQAVASAMQGTAEQLQTLFVALCRAHGLLVRSVRCADHPCESS